MPIDKPQKSSNGLMSSPAVKAVMAYYTGGATAAGASLIGSKNPALGAAVNAAAGSADAKAPGVSENDSPYRYDVLQKPEVGSQFQTPGPNLGVGEQESPMARRFSLSPENQAGHAEAIEQGLQGLQTLRESNPELYDQLAPDLAPAFLQVKHFHLKGGQ